MPVEFAMAIAPDPVWVGLAALLRRVLGVPGVQPPRPLSKLAWAPVNRLPDHPAAGVTVLPAFALAPIGSAAAPSATATRPSSMTRQCRRARVRPDRFMNHLGTGCPSSRRAARIT